MAKRCKHLVLKPRVMMLADFAGDSTIYVDLSTRGVKDYPVLVVVLPFCDYT